MPFVTKDVITVSDFTPLAKRVLGVCSDEEMYSYLNEAVELLMNLGLWDPLVGYMDICTSGCEITLPDDVEVPLAINVGSRPADFRNKWFEFHLNGPGSDCCGTCLSSWTDKGNFPTFRDPIQASQVAAYPEGTEAPGTNIRVYGFDDAGKWIMTANSLGQLEDGFDVPVLFGLGSGMTTTQKVKRIIRIQKPETVNFVKLVALDPGSSSGGTLLGLFKPSDTEPMFRRISVSGGGTQFLFTNSTTNTAACCKTWVRMRFRKKMWKLSSPDDVIFLHSTTALKMALMAVKKYESDLLGEYQNYKAEAKVALMEEQKSRSGPNRMRVQFDAGVYGYQCGDGMV